MLGYLITITLQNSIKLNEWSTEISFISYYISMADKEWAKMDIVWIDVDKIIPYEFNNKFHDETQINRLANSIAEFWFKNPMLLTEDLIVVNGHWRLEWAKKLWWKKVPCIIAKDLTEEQIKKFRILDNKLNESEWDLANLKLELDSLWDLSMGELQLSVSDLFPEFDAPEFNPEDYEDLWLWWKESKLFLTVYVKDNWELELLKKDLTDLWYTNYK